MAFLETDNVQTDGNPRMKQWLPGYLIILGFSGIVYFLSCAPGGLWHDSGMFHHRVWQNDFRGYWGLALAHPLYFLVGAVAKAIPLGEFSFRVNLISAVFAAFTVANVFLLLKIWFKSYLPAIVGALTLMFSWTFWMHASMAEVYTLYTAIFTAELIFLFLYLKLLKPGYLNLLAFFNGLSISNHMFGIFPLFVYLIWVVWLFKEKKITLKQLCFLAIFWLLGTAPYSYLIVEMFLQTNDLVGTFYSALFGNLFSEEVLNSSITGRIVLENFIFLTYNFPTPNILLIFLGFLALYKTKNNNEFGNFILVLSVLFFIFAFRYTVSDRHSFFIPFYVLASIMTG